MNLFQVSSKTGRQDSVHIMVDKFVAETINRMFIFN